MMEVVKEKVELQRYPEYKDSGLDWLGEIPKDWGLKRANYVFDVIDERSKSGKEELLSVSEHHGVKKRSESTVNMFMAESYKGYKLCYPGDLVINSLWAWSRGLGVSNLKGIVSTAYSVFRPDHENYDQKFLHYLLRTRKYVAQYLIASKGIWISRLQLSDWAFLRIPILSPSKEEQTAIANFLDRKTEQIDQAIEIKQRQIELLKERRQILIHKAVTRGLNPDVPFKPSGVDWIGDIPEHWEVKKMKYLFDYIQTGTTPSTESSNFFGGKIDWYKPEDLNNKILRSSKEKLSKLALLKKQIKLFPADSVLIIGIGGTTGKTSYLEKAGTFNQQITGFHSKKNFNKYFYYMLDGFSSTMLKIANFTTLPILNNEFFKSFRLVEPPKKEQQQIVDYLQNVDSETNKSLRIKVDEITKLKEYKTTLINSAVTGKIKVS